MIGREDLAVDPRFSTMEAAKKNETELVEIFDAYFAQHDWAEVDANLARLDIAHNRIAHFSDLANDEQARANNYVYEFTGRGGQRDIIAATRSNSVPTMQLRTGTRPFWARTLWRLCKNSVTATQRFRSAEKAGHYGPRLEEDDPVWILI
jgi:crotonobetainyl-CoA:carnitine CoA-transferase CaiB-like acyl-CoA transferase